MIPLNERLGMIEKLDFGQIGGLGRVASIPLLQDYFSIRSKRGS